MDIDHWDETISLTFKNITENIAKCKNKKTNESVKNAIITKEFPALFDRLRGLQKSYRREMLNIGNASDKREAKQRFDEIKKTYKNLEGEVKWLQKANDQSTLLGAEAVVNKVSDDQIADQMLKVQDQDIESLKGMTGLVDEIKQVGLNTAANLNEQTNQLERINTKASGIQNDIKRANRILYAYRRRMMQDRATVILLLLVVLGIIGIVIYSTVVPDQSSFAVPDEAKPPTPEEVERATRL